MENIIIIGSLGQAKLVAEVVEKEGCYSIVGFLDRFRDVGEKSIGYEIIGQEEDLPQLVQKHNLKGGIIAIADNYVRYTVSKMITTMLPDFHWVTAIHPNANIARDVQIGCGTVIMSGCSVNMSAVVGNHCILNTNSSLDHDSKMGHYSSLGPNSVTGGSVSIDSFTAIGIGATIKHKINIGPHTLIGAGSLVIHDIGSNSVAYGVPAKVIRNRKAGEQYL